MRTIKLIIIILAVSVVLFFLGLFIFLKTVDLNRFKTQIAEQISKSIQRDVQMRHVSFNFSISQGVTLKISGLSVADLPDFSSDPMLYIDSSHLDIDIMSFILKRQILVSKVELNSLKVNLVRDNNGELNVQKLTEKKKSHPTEADDETVSPQKKEGSNGTQEKETKDLDFSGMLVRSIRITDSTFIFTDHMTEPSIMVIVEDVDFQISNLSLNAPFPFDFKASVWSNKKNIQIKGMAQIDAQNKQVRVDDLKMQTDFSDLLLDRMYEGVPSLKDAGFKGGVEGKLGINVHQMILGEKGLLVLSSDGQMTDVKVQFKSSPIPIENLDMQFSMTESDIDISEITMPLTSGEMRISGRLLEYLKEQKFLADLKMTNGQLSELAAKMNFPVKLAGQYQAEYKLNGLGVSKEALESFLEGEGVYEVNNGRIADLNILKFVLSKISFIPNLAEKIEANLPPKYKEKMQAKDTILHKVEIDTKIHEGVVFINRAEISADEFLLLASGNLDLDQKLHLKADFYIPSDLSSSMVAVSNELKYFLDERQRIHIPLKTYDGQLANFRIYPDVEDFGKEVIRNRGKEELKKVIFKALDIDDQKPDEAPSEGSGTLGQSPENSEGKLPETREQTPEEAIIKNIFDMIPIFQQE